MSIDKGCPRPSGLIGRILSYLQSVRCTILHDKYLHGSQGEGIQPHFIKIARCNPGWSIAHKIYWPALENFVIILLTFDTSITSPALYRPADTAAWVQKFRDEHFSHQFKNVLGINHALPLKQGCPPDPRFALERRCANPVADCPINTPGFPICKKWTSTHIDTLGAVFAGKQLCEACHAYVAAYGKHRSQEIIDQYFVDLEVKELKAQHTDCW